MWRTFIPIGLLSGLSDCSGREPVGPGCPSVLPNWSEPQDGRSAFRPMNVIAFSTEGVTWNGQPISDERLREYLAAGRKMNPVPFTVLDPTGAPNCGTASKLRDAVNEAADCQGGRVCGQGRLGDWKNADGLSGPGSVE